MTPLSRRRGVGGEASGGEASGGESFFLHQRRSLQLLESSAELIGARGAAHTTVDAIEFADDIVDVLTGDQLADALQVTIATTHKEHLLDDVVLVGCDVNQF